jgi:CheY-like chemotaxis protein
VGAVIPIMTSGVMATGLTAIGIFWKPEMAGSSRRIRILIVEDNVGRIEQFRAWLPTDCIVVFASSAGRAIGVLQRDAAVISGIMLDHDLNEQAVTDRDRYLSGTNVTELIVRVVPRHVPILVHSMNETQGGRIARRLNAAGFSVTRARMADLTRERFDEWLQEVRDCTEDEG